jgi:hypothetical protein
VRLEYLKWAEVIRHHARGEPVHFLINPGNWGDALIRAGTEHFLQTFGIAYRPLYLDDSLASRLRRLAAGLGGGVLLCSGGGAWCGHFNHLPRSVEVIMRRSRYRKIIVLPSTFDRPFDFPGVQFFRRDQSGSAQAMPQAEFCHDLAFFLPTLESAAPDLDRAFCFRRDVESSGEHAIPPDNLDLSAMGTQADDVHPFFAHLARFREIHTDRLHVAVGASLLNRQVHLYPGRYFKNKAIFDASLAPFFPSTHFHDHFDLPALDATTQAPAGGTAPVAAAPRGAEGARP